MKGGAGTTKRRRGWLVIAVWCLVIFSTLVSLVFLLRFNSLGYIHEQGTPASNQLDLKDTAWNNGVIIQDPSKVGQSRDIDDILKRSEPAISKDAIENYVEDKKNKTIAKGDVQSSQQTKDSSMKSDMVSTHANLKNSTVGGAEVTQSIEVADEGDEISCGLKYGSYCLWRQEHKEKMQDSMVKRLKDRLFVARAYFPSIAKLPAHGKLSRDMKQNIQELEHILIETTTDADLPPLVKNKLQKMDGIIARAKSVKVDCNNVYKKFSQLVDLTEDEANFHMKQSAYLYQIAVQTVPKSLHCLSMRLTVEYFASPLSDVELLLAAKYMNPAMQHYAILSHNVLASSVVINSTVMHSEESANQFFHVLTNEQNYFAMKQWFIRTTYKEAIVQVLNIEDLNLEYRDKTTLHLSLPEEFRVSLRDVSSPPSNRFYTDYISSFSHTHFLLPEIFHNLNRLIVLDDDVIVQQDLSALWSLNMDGKVIGAVPHCKVRLGNLKKYLGANVEDNSCTWMSGLNVIDLVRWREQNITGTYKRLLKEKRSKRRSPSTETTALRASLLALHNKIYPLDGRWVLSGLGYNYRLNIESIKSAAVLHYNGKMKPWLDLGISKYKSYWKKYLNLGDQFLSVCNINP